ncbi:MAG: aspartyl/asparaginyl beta-hydroxylase domain-containing protein, partial [Crocinitomicaceae bacterium]
MGLIKINFNLAPIRLDVNHMSKMWFSIYDSSLNYKGNEPEFFDSEQFEWAKEISKHTDTILEELKAYTLENELPSYFNESMVEKKNTWRTIPLKTWSIEQNKNQQHFPRTTALINKYPEIISASFNLLEANSKIKSHCGDTNTIYRCHLGLDIPDGLPNC